jgi:DNA-binding beta-propeller fold protein YncE
MTQMLVTSAGGANGNGYGAILAFGSRGELEGPFSDDPRITDPRGMSLDPAGELVYLNSGDDRVLALDQSGHVVLESGRIERLDPGGGYFGPDGRYYVTLRTRRTVGAFPASLDGPPSPVMRDDVVPFPRGFGFASNGDLYLASGIGPSGEGDNTITVFDKAGAVRVPHLVEDPELSPLDLIVAPNGNIVVSSEWPFGERHATTTIREYEPLTGSLVRVLVPDPTIGFAKPRGLRFGAGHRLYWVGKSHVVAFDFGSGRFLGIVVQLERLNGQAVIVLPEPATDGQ